jgi:hypothetical protein
MRKFFLIFLFLLVFPPAGFADQEGPPVPFTAETADKQFIFVMLTPNCALCWGGDRYDQSGMYRNDGSRVPLWTVDWQNYIFLPGDGKHLVRLGPWTRYSATYREEIFSFIVEGRDLKTYRARELVDFPYLLPHSSSHYRVIRSPFDRNLPNDGVVMKIDHGEGYPLNGGVTIDNENNTILIETLHSDKYLFDLNTGNIISSEHPTRKTATGLFGVLIIGLALYLFLAVKINLSEFALRIASAAAGFFVTLFLFLIPVIAVSLNQTVYNSEIADTPDFWIYCYLMVSLFPRYLLTSLNLISGPENNNVSAGLETILQWLIVFWIPCILLFGLLLYCIAIKIKSKKFRKV